jgi:membrane fusion protein (multidrug efflux system)
MIFFSTNFQLSNNIIKSMKKLVLLLCIVSGFAACKSNKEEKKEDGKFPITSPLLMDTSFTKEYVAQIQSLQNIEIHAMVKGYIQTINVDEGQHVISGQVLFTIVPKEYEAELQKAKAEAKTTELEMLNVKTLAEKNIVSKTELALAEAKLDEEKAKVTLAELNLSYTTVRAAFDGTIDRIKFKVGSLIDEGTLLTTLSNNKEIYTYFNVSENEYLNFQTRNKNNTNDSVALLLANNQQFKYKGVMQMAASEFDNNTGNISFRAKFPNHDLLLKHGETGKIQLIVDLKNALVIPQKSTFEIQDKIYVYVIDQNNVAHAKAISIKQKISNLYIVGDELSEKDKILLEGVQNIKDDDKIQTEFISPKLAIDQLQLIKQ